MIRYGDYRDKLRAKGLQPLRIERTERHPGDLVLVRTDKPAEIVPCHALA